MNKIFSFLAATAVILSASGAFAGNMSNTSADATPKPISKVSDVKNMNDDTMVYIQGYITQNLGDEKYTFQDESGTMTVEIDGDLMKNNSVSPTTLVWIAAEVDKDGDIVELDAEEIQIMPENNMASSSDSKK